MELADDIRDKNLGISVHTINNTGTTPEQTLELIMSMIWMVRIVSNLFYIINIRRRR